MPKNRKTYSNSSNSLDSIRDSQPAGNFPISEGNSVFRLADSEWMTSAFYWTLLSIEMKNTTMKIIESEKKEAMTFGKQRRKEIKLRITVLKNMQIIVADADRANDSMPAENEAEERSEAEYGSTCLRVCVAVGELPEKLSVLHRRRSLLLIHILIVCCLIVAMPSGKRETERKGNAPVNTGLSPNSDGRANNTVEEADVTMNNQKQGPTTM
ncbi:hypothetical protein T07_10578 [Trichinella nelsoni]|uniref:Uncharacterized protein n=1 Tax=Trichinella nelsoni TaxID=6336 RepID=A0A0V0RFA1_9BILA|nr:hypothetical protein T07_10578 [Trichinella nelsoni]